MTITWVFLNSKRTILFFFFFLCFLEEDFLMTKESQLWQKKTPWNWGLKFHPGNIWAYSFHLWTHLLTTILFYRKWMKLCHCYSAQSRWSSFLTLIPQSCFLHSTNGRYTCMKLSHMSWKEPLRLSKKTLIRIQALDIINDVCVAGACSIVSDSLLPCGLEPAGLLCLWSPGVGYHFFVQINDIDNIIYNVGNMLLNLSLLFDMQYCNSIMQFNSITCILWFLSGIYHFYHQTQVSEI